MELGEHRLKDIEQAVPLFQLGEGSFPPLKTIANTNLPTPASSFLGREEELHEADLLLQAIRLLTIAGPGGQGKTRFALELATRARNERFSDYPAGVFACFLSSLQDSSLVLPTLCQTLAVREQPGESALAALTSHLQGKKLLLLLDNLEHLLESASALSQLVQACGGLTLLVTSRELLRIEGERAYALPALAQAEGVALFCERAQTEPSAEIAELCHCLEGLPLAIELAAARMAILTPSQLLERISQRLDLLKGGRDADPRQRTLRATIEWSYDLLSPVEQELFARLSVFRGGCTLEAAEEVCKADLDTLHSLVDKSLLRFTEERFWMLETIREFAAEQLERSGEADEERSLHATRCARVAVELERPLRDYSDEARATVQDELDNLRAALAFALDRGDVVVASDLLSGLWFFWLTSGRGNEANSWAQRYIACPRELVEPLERYRGDMSAAEIFRFAGDPAVAMELKRQAVATGRANPNAVIHGMAIERSLAATLSDLAHMELAAGHLDEARVHADEALALRRSLGLPHGIAHALLGVAAVEYNTRDFARAGELYAEAAAVAEAARSRGDVVEARLGLAECEMLLGRLDEANRLLRQALVGVQKIADQSLEIVIIGLRVAGTIAAARSDPESSAVLLGATEGQLRDSGLTLFGPLEEELQRASLERARLALGDDRFRASWTRGASMSVDEALGLALRHTSGLPSAFRPP